jgi:diguanylate cyclase (GGDEF)-like protein
VPFLLFFVVIVAARGMAFDLLERTKVSLDAAFYVSAALCLGAVPAGQLVAAALTLDSLLRLISRRQLLRDEPSSRADALAYSFYFGGMTGALLTSCAWLFGTDEIGVHAAEPVILGEVFALGASFLLAHYFLQGLRQRLLGRPLREYARGIAVRGGLAEASLLPLAVVVVLVYDPRRVLPVVLLGATFLLINFVFNRLSRTGAILRRRVQELEILEATARRLGASLQLREVVDTVHRQTLEAIPEATGVVLYQRDQPTRIDEGAEQVLWVIEHGEALSADGWLAVPIQIHGEVDGVLAVHGPGSFRDDQRRLLEAISAQVSVALQNARLYDLAMVDGLTGLFVRRYFDARLDEEIERTKRFGTVFSVVMMDIDNFKELNDTHGHPVGDFVLRELAAVIRGQMRGVDTAARYGGEEISMILPRTEMVAAYNVAERVRRKIEGWEPEIDGVAVRVTASFGIAAYPESEATGPEDLVRRADKALYRAKKTGKNRVELYWADGDDARSSLRSL